MPQAAYPVAADVENLLASMALFDEEELESVLDFLPLDIIVAAASRTFEEETGWIPFLADAADVTRFFDPPGPNRRPQIQGGGYPLDLRAGLVALTSITTGIATGSAGTALTLDTDFWLTPYNADELGRPWTALEFVVGQWGVRRSIKVVGRWGYSATVPDDAWLAILHKAVGLALPEIATRVSGGVRKFSELGVTEEYGDGFLTGTGATGASGDGSAGGAWAREWRDTVRRYKRVVL